MRRVAITLVAAAALSLAAATGDLISEDFEHGLPRLWQSNVLGTNAHGGQAAIGVDPDANHFLRLQTADSFFGIGVRKRFEARAYPWLSWRWRVHQLPSGADISRKSADDCAARVYVVFSSPSLLHPLATRALVYVWDNSHPAGVTIPNPYAPANEKVIVLETGTNRLGHWVSERGNLYDDYRRAFGERPDGIEAIAFASDSDNTHSATLSDFDDLRVSQTAP